MLFISGNVPLPDQANADNLTSCVIQTFLDAQKANIFPEWQTLIVPISILIFFSFPPHELD